MAHIEDGPEGCTCKHNTIGTGGTSIISTGGTWSAGGYYSPVYTYSSDYHAPKCQNCGYCSCCGKSEIPGKLTPGFEG